VIVCYSMQGPDGPDEKDRVYVNEFHRKYMP
jgi:hypothetical protein